MEGDESRAPSAVAEPASRRHRYTLAQLEALPVLAVGQADDLHFEEDGMRVWLSRVEPYVVEVERWTAESGWRTSERYVIRHPDCPRRPSVVARASA
jgi:hypothetical protein